MDFWTNGAPPRRFQVLGNITDRRMRTGIYGAIRMSNLDGEIAKTTETPQRLAAVAVWQEAPFFSDAERAALGLAEAITRLADRTDRVPDAIWAEAARHYDETALAWLVLDVSVVNLYNRLNVATRQIAGAQQW